jgi:hypothetical protein
VSDQKCIYRRYKSPRPGSNDCGLSVDAHKEVRDHDFQPPLEITAEAVEAAEDVLRRYAYTRFSPHDCVQTAIEAALRVMQKGQDE